MLEINIKRTIDWALIFYLLYWSVIVASSSRETSVAKHRIKRKVVFSKSSKMFFRLNGKDNVFNQTDIFAHGWAFRVNWDLPDTILRRRKFFKRDVNSEVQDIGNDHNMLVYSCILKYVCETVSILHLDENCGMLCGIGNIIAKSQGIEAGFFKSFIKDCRYHSDNCMQSFQG